MRQSGWMRGARLSSVGAIVAAGLLTGCGQTTTLGADAGCMSYAEARLAMPRAEPIGGAWGEWVADLDDRMTGSCR
jgi:hypothetical protein